MATKEEKAYRAWPSGPPTYQQANSSESQRITQNPKWNYSLFECFSPCTLCACHPNCASFLSSDETNLVFKGLTSWCLPCLTFGKTQSRVQDPTLQNHSSINAECTIFTLLTLGYSQWIIQTIRRGEMRQRHGIEGSCCGDCCATFWCGCCALIQEEKEMELRTRPELTGYQSAPQMAYPC